MIQSNLHLLMDQTSKLIKAHNVFMGFLVYFWNKLLFPHKNFEIWFSSVMVFILLDLFTKYFAISTKCGGIKCALKSRVISSHKYWKGLKVKLFGYLVITLMISTLYNSFPYKSRILDIGMFIYILIDLRETQSVLENLVDAGLQVGWLAKIVKKRTSDLEEKFKGDDKDE